MDDLERYERAHAFDPPPVDWGDYEQRREHQRFAEWERREEEENTTKKEATMRKRIVCTALSTIICLFLSATIAQAATYQGADRYETAALIATKSGAKDITIVSGESFPDALSAQNLGNPILLTMADGIPAVTMSAIYTLEPDTITIVGGTSVVNTDVERQLANYAPTTRIAGENRYETNVLTIHGTDIPATVASGESFPDALSASNLGNQIFLVKRDSIPEATKQALAKADPFAITIVGGTAAVNEQVEADLANYCQPSRSSYRDFDIFRLAGADRYATNLLTIGDFSVLTFASGENYPDALAASYIGDQLMLLPSDASYRWIMDYGRMAIEYNYVGGVLDMEAIEAAIKGEWGSADAATD